MESLRRMNLLRDMLLSFCPEAFRRKQRPYSSSSLVTAAIVLGLIQLVVCALLLTQRYKHFMIARSHLWATQMNGRPEWVQSGGAALITFEFFLYPLSFLLLYFCIEGFLRFAAGITSSEVVPSLPVVCVFKVVESVKKRRHIKEELSLPPDHVEVLADGRLRIAAARPKPGWNAAITIGIEDRWYEVERETRASESRSWVYVLRPSPVGKIFRKVERYECPPGHSSSGAAQTNSESHRQSPPTPVENLD